MKTTVIIVAAGMGTRMASETTKQLICIGNKPILWHTINAFQQMKCIDNIVLVVKQDEKDEITKDIVKIGGFTKVTEVVAGGKERSDSVLNGLSSVAPDALVLIHDGARPFIKESSVKRLIEVLEYHSAAILAVPVKDTIKQVNSREEVVRTYDRKALWAVQTPQGFNYQVIKDAFDGAELLQSIIYDDAMLVEVISPNNKIKVVMGDETNIKITTPYDLIIGEAIYRMNEGV